MSQAVKAMRLPHGDFTTFVEESPVKAFVVEALVVEALVVEAVVVETSVFIA